MEVLGVERIWLRSVQDLNLQCTTFIGDGDSKSFTNLVEIKLYGDGVKLIKHECVGHVQKRMGTALRNLKKSGVTDPDTSFPVKFRGKLTNKPIQALNVYYGGAIRNSKGSVDAMITAIDASFLHSTSTDENPSHSKCPEHDPENPTWCKFNKAEYIKMFEPEYVKQFGQFKI